MKTYLIKYQQSNHIMLKEVEAENSIEARYKFYMEETGAADILEIKEKE